ncbi:MAG: phosphodiesterase [Pseudomonadota bacterium]
MKLLHFTDIHLTTPGQTIGGRDPNANFEAALAHALQTHPDADRIVITGDLSDWGDRADYERLRTRIAALALPVELCIGNHDDRETFLSVFPEHADEHGFVQRVFDLPIGIGITLDTCWPETHAGRYCERRRLWLDAQVADAPGPVWLFMHHNPVPTGVVPTDRIMLQDADSFGVVIARHARKIRHIFFGHCHMPLTGSFHGVPVSAPRGTNHASFANFAERRLLTRSALPEAYGVISVDGPSVTVHMIEFTHADALTVEGSPDYADWDRASMAR